MWRNAAATGAGRKLALQGDGNLVIYEADGSPWWAIR